MNRKKMLVIEKNANNNEKDLQMLGVEGLDDTVSSAGSHALCDCACSNFKFLCSQRVRAYLSSGLTGYLDSLFHHLLCQTTLTPTF